MADRPVVPAFNYIVSIAAATAGADGDYSDPSDPASVRPWLDAIRQVGGVLVIDIQPGRRDFLSEIKRYESLLVEPDVSLALDPEWRMGPTQVPGQVIGSVSVDELNEATRYLAGLVQQNGLPRKLLVIHQFTPFMITERHRLETPPELTTVIQLDGFGSPAQKVAKYVELRPAPPVYAGFKLFLQQDTRLMRPDEVLALDPRPMFVSYQ